MSEYFVERPEDSVGGPLLPEEYIPREVESMWPDQVLFLGTECIVADTQRRLSIHTDYPYLPCDGDAANASDNVGVMRFYRQLSSGEVIDGYIVDIRNISPGDIEIEDGEADEEDGAETVMESQPATGALVPVLGIIFPDGEGIRYVSSKRAETIDAAAFLAAAVDTALAESEQVEQTEDDEESEGAGTLGQGEHDPASADVQEQ